MPNFSEADFIRYDVNSVAAVRPEKSGIKNIPVRFLTPEETSMINVISAGRVLRATDRKINKELLDWASRVVRFDRERRMQNERYDW